MSTSTKMLGRHLAIVLFKPFENRKFHPLYIDLNEIDRLTLEQLVASQKPDGPARLLSQRDAAEVHRDRASDDCGAWGVREAKSQIAHVHLLMKLIEINVDPQIMIASGFGSMQMIRRAPRNLAA